MFAVRYDNGARASAVCGVDKGRFFFCVLYYALYRRRVGADNGNYPARGDNVSEAQAESVRDVLETKLGGEVEVNVINGGQPIYYFIISVE